MRIKKGEKAPVFSVEDIYGNSIDLNEYRGKNTLLCFFRGAACPFCNLRVHELIHLKEQLDSKNIQVIMFFTGNKKEIMKHVGKQQSPYPIIADPFLSIYKRYAVESSFFGMLKGMLRVKTLFRIMKLGFFSLASMKDRNTLPAEFLLDSDLIVQIPYYAKDFGDHLEIQKIINENDEV